MENYDQSPFDSAEFAENTEPRCACALILDVSLSMRGVSIAALNAGLQSFAKDVKEDRLTSKRAEICVVTFGGKVDVVSEFTSAQDFAPQTLTASGNTPMGEAINTAIDLIAARQAQYRANGISVYRPVALMVTDGTPTDNWASAARRIRQGEEQKKFSFFAVGVDGADMDTLAQISANAPVMLRDLEFASMFRWLSTSLSAVSRSQVGERVALANPAGPTGWASIG